MKLYAKIQAGRGGREAVKGDDSQLDITLSYGNNTIGLLEYYTLSNGSYRLYWNSKLIEEGKGKTQKGEQDIRHCHLCGSIEVGGGWCTNETCTEYQ